MGKRPLSKKELEEQRKKEQEQAAAQVNSVAYYLTFLLSGYFVSIIYIVYRHLKNLWQHFKKHLVKQPIKSGLKQEHMMQAKDVSIVAVLYIFKN